MLTLYPAIQPFNDFMLKVDEPHEIYVEQCGNPNGLPVVFIHGGPGAGCQESDRSFFDPEIYHIILFDQRGAGRSIPHACLEKNTTQHLIADIELIRQKLNINQWLVFGGSWGSTLGLAYAQAHPEAVLGLILRGIYLGSQQATNWLYGHVGAADIFPDYFEEFLAPLSLDKQQQENLVAPYYELLTSDDEIKRMAAAKAWSIWEGRISTLEPNPNKEALYSDPHFALGMARIECHYFKHDCFLAPEQLISNVNKLQDIPGYIVHGRYDIVCTARQAWQLHKLWPNSNLQFVRDAGHSSGEPGITDALVKATQHFAERQA